MPQIASGGNATFAITASNIIEIQCPGGWVQLETPVGTKVFEGNPAGHAFGPYAAGDAKITSVQGAVYYEVAAKPGGSSPIDPNAVAITGGTINGTSVGATTASSGRFTTLQVAEGANAKQGTATLVAGAATVSNTSVTANSRIFLTSNVDGGTPGFLRVSARVAGTSFTITSSSGTDTSTVAYVIFEPA